MTAASPSSERKITLPQLLALMAIWTAVIYGLGVKPPAQTERISLKTKSAACSKG